MGKPENGLPEIDSYRKSILAIAKKLGGNAAIYYNEEETMYQIFPLQEDVSFAQMHHQLQQYYGAAYAPISTVLRSDNHHTPASGAKKHKAFYDDFIGL